MPHSVNTSEPSRVCHAAIGRTLIYTLSLCNIPFQTKMSKNLPFDGYGLEPK
jgi:hypothetical protein